MQPKLASNWDDLPLNLVGSLENIQLTALRIISGLPRGTPHRVIYAETGFESLAVRRKHHRLFLLFQMLNGTAPPNLNSIAPTRTADLPEPRYNLRVRPDLIPIRANTDSYSRSFLPKSIVEWNELPADLRRCQSYPLFRKTLISTPLVLKCFF